jgi:hypothetical protein
VWTAVWGDSFGTAACSSFKLLWGNLGRTGAFSVVAMFLLFVGKVICAPLLFDPSARTRLGGVLTSLV